MRDPHFARSSLVVLAGATLALAASCNAILGNEAGELAGPGSASSAAGAGGGVGAGPTGSTAGSGAGPTGTTASSGAASGEGGAGGGAGSSASSGAGGMGGSAECSDPADCPGLDTTCGWRTCTSGSCGIAFAPEDTGVADETPGDCAAAACDGLGGTKAVEDDTDVFDDGKACTADACASGVAMNAPTAAGTLCVEDGGSICDGQGSCVQCLATTDCPSGVCQGKLCVPVGCSDGVKDGTESDVDCGGPACIGCGTGDNCVSGADCASTICTINVCAAPSCSDGAANGAETDVDCGGSCAPCGPGQGCSVDADCTGSLCTGSTCAPSCSDGVENASESDVDCGGPVCADCAVGDSCTSASDCASGYCYLPALVCNPAHCGDAVENGGESDVDCGGPCSKKCSLGNGCNAGSDCASGSCLLGLCL